MAVAMQTPSRVHCRPAGKYGLHMAKGLLAQVSHHRGLEGREEGVRVG